MTPTSITTEHLDPLTRTGTLTMKFTLVAFLLAGLSLASPILAHEGEASARRDTLQISPAAQPAVDVAEAFSAALKAGDFKRVGELLAPDVLILESGGAERSRQEYLAHHAISDAAFLAGSHSVLKHRTARVDGDMAWIGSESELHAKKDNKPVTLVSTETLVLRKGEGGWQIVHVHWSSRAKR